MSRRNLFSIFIAVIILGSVAYGITWDDGSGVNHYWSTPNNWDENRVPNASDEVDVVGDLSAERQPVIQAGTIAGCSSLDVSGGEGGLPPGTVAPVLTILQNGSLSADFIILGIWYQDASGKLMMLGGDVNCASLWIGYRGVGTIEMTGGKIDCNDKLEIAIGYESPPGNVVLGSGYVHLDGGTIETNSIAMRTAYLQSTPEPVEDANALGWMDITGGTLIIGECCFWPGNPREKIEEYFDNGWLTAYGVGSMEEGNIATPERAMLVIDENWRNEYKTTVTAYKAAPGEAYDLYPPPYTEDVVWYVTLTWKPGDYVAYGGTGQTGNGHHVFLHTNKSYVDGANLNYPVGEQYGHIIGAQDSNSFSIAENMCAPLHGDTVYYWRVIEANDGNTWRSQVQAFRTLGDCGCGAYTVPSSGSEIAATEVLLQWCSFGLDEYDLYFGVDFTDVNTATVSNPKGVYVGRQDDPNYLVAGLERGRTYYWRVDPIDWCGNVSKGYVHWFTVVCPGDFDANDAVNLRDLAYLAAYWMKDCSGEPNDCNKVDIYPPFEGDGQVNMADLDVFTDCWLWVSP
jgi:hypothetical protein